MLGRRDYIHNRLCKYIYVCVCGVIWNRMEWYGMVWHAWMHACMDACMDACMHVCTYLCIVMLCRVLF